MHVEVVDPLDDAEPDYWPALRAKAGLRADWDFALLREAAPMAPGRLLITVLRDADEPVAVVAAVLTGPRGRPRRRGRFPALGVLDVKSPGTSAVPGWWIAPERTGEAAQLFAGYLRGMRRELGLRCRGVLWRQVTDDRVAAARATARLTIARPTVPVLALPVQGRSAEQWLSGLSKNRRRSLSKGRRALTESPGLRCTFGPGIDLDPVKAQSLVGLSKARYRDEPWAGPIPESSAYFAALLTHPEVLVAGYVRDGEPVALMTAFDHPQWPVLRHWGALDIDAGGVRNGWADAMFHMIDWACTQGKTGVNMGRGKAELKVTLGAKPVPQQVVLALRR